MNPLKPLLLLPLFAAVQLAGCATIKNPDGSINWSATIAKDTAAVKAAAPVVAKEVVEIGGALVAVECQDSANLAQSAAGAAAVAAKSADGGALVTAAKKDSANVANFLQANAEIASIWCPYYAIATSVVKTGAVPATAPAQVIPAAGV